MKKFALLFLSVALVHTLSAQNQAPEKRTKGWFDWQLVQHVGLNPWSNTSYVNRGLPRTSLTELKGVLHIGGKYFGVFADMGVGIMPAPKMKSLDLTSIPMPYKGTQYYLREVLSGDENTGASAHFKMTYGLFGKISVDEKLTVMPYLGVGFFTTPRRQYDVLLKEEGSNMQYYATYVWNADEFGGDVNTQSYLSGRLNFNYKFSEKINLLFGLEYTRIFTPLNFYGKYTNTFNANIEKEINAKGRKMNMLGLSVGISFM